jgi:hypothetical protein
MQVETLAAVPGVAGQRLQRLQVQVIAHAGAEAFEEGVEDPAHREHGGTGVEPAPGDLDLAQLAARPGGPLQDRHLAAGHGQFRRRDEATDPRADHDHPATAHAAGPGVAAR